MLLAILAVVAAGAAAEKPLPKEDVVEVPAIGQGLCVANVFQDFSAIGYIFGRRVHLAAGVPVGLIDASVGGTTVETWTPEDVLRKIEGGETKALLKDWG